MSYLNFFMNFCNLVLIFSMPPFQAGGSISSEKNTLTILQKMVYNRHIPEKRGRMHAKAVKMPPNL